MKFTKMHGCGNDYIYFDCMHGVDISLDDKHIANNAIRLSDRHFSIGGDGVVLICKSNIATAKMRMFNADGSEGKMCGNASRCIAKYLYDKGYVDCDEIFLETLSGVKHIKLHIVGGICVGATVNMGLPILKPSEVPVNEKLLKASFMDVDKIVAMPIDVDGKTYNITAVSMGNPHCVVFIKEDVSNFDLERIGAAFEMLPLFPQRVNTEFVNIIGDNILKMRVWERGSGETLACGTGSCAVAVAAVLNGVAVKDKPIEIQLAGGVLSIFVTDEGVLMSGPAEIAYEGEIQL